MRTIALGLVALLALILADTGIVPAQALEKNKYDAIAFKAAQTANKSILIDVSAAWCPTCKAQHKVLESLAKRPEFAEIVIFEVDFDSQKDALKTFNARQQSTLIAFRGSEETKRSVGNYPTRSSVNISAPSSEAVSGCRGSLWRKSTRDFLQQSEEAALAV